MTPQPTALAGGARNRSMTEEERTELADEARSAILDIQKRMGALGIDLSTQKPKRRPLSPDGGPESDAHTFLKTHLIPTMEVIIIENGAEAVIRRADFDPSLHRKVKAARRQRTPIDGTPYTQSRHPTAPVERKRSPFVVSGLRLGTESREELMQIALPILRNMPEAVLMQDPPEDKAQLVDRILELREQLSRVED